jgi:ferredoxin
VTRRILAWLNLAWHFAVQITTRLPARWLGRDRSAARFRDTTLAEGYVPLNADERALTPAAMGCIHCGLCSLACPVLRAAPASAWDEAWTFVAGPSRSLDATPLAALQASACANCDACARVCPTDVPIPALAAWVERMAESVTRNETMRSNFHP